MIIGKSGQRRRPTPRPIAPIAAFAHLERLEGRRLLSVTLHDLTTSLEMPTDLASGTHTVTVQAKDTAGNTALINSAPLPVPAATPTEAPHTPVFSTEYDLSQITHDFPNGNGSEHPWNISFDRTTQTTWLALRGGTDGPLQEPDGGNRIVQFDPATSTARVYSLQDFTRDNDPHGTFFDFESHLTPRVWFTQRPSGLLANERMPLVGEGEVSYLDLATNELVVYDLQKMLRAGGFPNAVGDFHAIVVDRTGNAWVSDPDDGLLLELDFHRNPDGTPNPSLNADTGALIVHKIPPEILGVPLTNTGDENKEAGPHGIDTVVDDKTGQAYVYATELGAGRVILLRPGAGPGGGDLWTTWDLSTALQPGGANTAPGGPVGGVPQFVGVDNNETPNDPFDDKIYFGDPGTDTPVFGQTGSGPNDVIRVIDVGAFLANPSFTSSPVQTWSLPDMPGGGMSRPNQVFVDREGRVYYIDRQNGVGRLDPSAPMPPDPSRTPGAAIQAPITPGHSQPSALPLVPLPRLPMGSIVPISLGSVLMQSPEFTQDHSTIQGLNQYELTHPVFTGPHPPRGHMYDGPFRGALNAGSVLYGALTHSDRVSTTIFAETARRQMTVVTGPGDARMAFQVLRDGSLVMTGHGPGALVDSQVNLTRAIGGPPINGDVSAVADNRGDVHVFGRSSSGGLVEYLDTAATRTWTVRAIGMPPNGIITVTPAAFNDPIRGAAALATTDRGHLVLFYDDGSPPIDLTAQGGGDAGRVYSTADAVVQDGRVYAYGTNQQGGLIEYQFPVGGGPATFRAVNLPGGRDTMIFQDVSAIVVGSTRQVFGSDGNSRLVHVTIGPNGDSAENVTELAQGGAVGYSPYQMPFAGRVYSDLGVALDPTNGDLYAYGTNGRDLVEFRKPADGSPWQVTDLTNALPANRVFGAPTAYITPNGDRHILQIDEEGEVVEYYKLKGLAFATQNITLSLGNTSSPPSFPTTLPVTTIGSAPATVPSPQRPFQGRFPVPRRGAVVGPAPLRRPPKLAKLPASPHPQHQASLPRSVSRSLRPLLQKIVPTKLKRRSHP